MLRKLLVELDIFVSHACIYGDKWISSKSCWGGQFVRIKRRAKQLLVPFLIWTFISVCINAGSGFWLSLFNKILYPSSGYWFLWVLWVETALVLLCSFLEERTKLRIEWVIGAGAVILTGLAVLTNTKVMALHLIALYFLFYSFGYLYRRHESLFKVFKSRKAIIILFLVWLSFASFWNMNKVPVFLSGIPFIPSSLINYMYRIITSTIGIMALLAAGEKYLNTSSVIINGTSTIGKISLGIYAFHMIIGPYINFFVGSHITQNCFLVITILLMR